MQFDTTFKFCWTIIIRCDACH